MPNIRRETKRHDWIHPVTIEGVENSSLCRNCRKTVKGREPSETSGCVFEVHTKNFSRDKMQRLTEYEMRLRQQQDAYDNEVLRRSGQIDDDGNLIQ